MLKKEKIKEFLFRFRVEVSCSMLFLIMMLRLVSPIFGIIGLIVASLLVINETDIKGLYYIAFIYPFRYIFKYQSKENYMFIILLCVWFLVLSIRFIIDKKYKQKENFIGLCLIIAFIVYAAIPRNLNFGFLACIEFCIILLLLYFGVVYKNNINFKKFLLIFSVSLILSSTIALFKNHIDSLNRLLIINDEYKTNTRFMGMDWDPNYYAVSVLVPMASILVLFLKDNINKILAAVLLCSLSCFGLLTISKSFILVLILMLFLICLFIMFEKKKDGFKYILILTVSIGFSFLICFNSTKLMFTRIIESLSSYQIRGVGCIIASKNLLLGDIGDFLDSFTTGRYAIWKTYFEYFAKNPVNLIFGSGFGNIALERPAHNTLIQGVYKVGLLGVFLIIAAFIYFIIISIKKEGRLYEFLSLFIFILLCMSLDFFISTGAVCYILMGIYCVGYKNNHKENETLLSTLLKRKNEENL